jgi:uncharacterized protein involved in propanediol utilization
MTTDDGPTRFPTKIHSATPIPSVLHDTRPNPPAPRRDSKNMQFHTGIGHARGHWGEIVQGWLLHDGELVVGLLTLPDPSYGTTAVVTPRRGTGIFSTQPEKWKAFKAAYLALEAVGVKTGVSFHLRSNIPLGVGAGSSTSDCTAIARAVVAAVGSNGKSMSDLDLLQKIVFAAEGPCDPLALLDWGLPVLWASRRGKVLHVFPRPLPELHALGFVTDPGRTVSTDALASAQATRFVPQAEVDAFAEILKKLEIAIATGSARGVGEAATASGMLNQKHCRIARWDQLSKLAENVGAVGLSCSHSGTAAALLWNPAKDDLAARVAEATAQAQQLGVTHIHEFRAS